MFYRLNSLVDRANDQGVLPHLLAIAALGNGDSTYIVPGVSAVLTGNQAVEVDLFGMRGSYRRGSQK